MKCHTCQRDTVKKGYCALHLKAYENIVKNYGLWKKALKISWKEYLSEIEQNSLTGEWAKEVASYLINKEGKISVEES